MHRLEMNIHFKSGLNILITPYVVTASKGNNILNNISEHHFEDMPGGKMAVPFGVLCSQLFFIPIYLALPSGE